MMAPERPGPEDEPCVALRGVSISDLPIYSLQGGLLRELKEGDGASIELSTVQDDQADKPAGDDNDLTSLSWLQDKNLLKEVLTCPDMNLQAGVGGSQESPTSDFVDDTTSELADSTCSSGNSPPSPPPVASTPTPSSGSRQKHPQHMPYDPQVHTTSKPPYSFSCLIFMAIEDSMQRALPVKDIYTWVLSHFPYFKNAPTGWKNSVRHNLSLNKCFRKVDKAPNLGKGSLWMVDPMYRPNLLQALQKAPFHPYTTLDRISMVTSRQTARPSERRVLGQNDTSVKPSSGRLPDPDLFPFLSRRLAASGADAGRHCSRDESDSTDGESLDDVDAAAAMMALKHGPRLLATRRDLWPTAREGASRRKKARAAQRAAAALVITTSPSEDHTYSAGPTPGSATVSPDEAYGEGSDTDESISRPRQYYSEVVVCKPTIAPTSYFPPSSHSDSEEQRKIAEGADALLNLAGIPTLDRCYPPLSTPSRPRKRHLSPSPTPPMPTASPAFRPRILRTARPKKEAKSRQRGNSRKKKLISNNNNNLVANGNAKLKIRNGDSARQLRSEEKSSKSRR